MPVRVLNRADVQRLICLADAVAAVREAFIAADRGRAVMPRPFELHLPDRDGELHVKGAYLLGAGALAADLLARPDARTAAVIGTGGQARYQLQALLEVRRVREVAVHGRRPEAAGQYVRDMSLPGVHVVAAETVREAVAGADIVITATSSTEPLLRREWLAAGAHVTAVGSDMPHKQELDPQVLAAADKYVPDSIDAARTSGELHHAVEAGVLDVASVYGELAALASGRLPGRTRDDELTVADLTGLGIQDAAVAAFVAGRAEELGAGENIPLAGA